MPGGSAVLMFKLTNVEESPLFKIHMKAEGIIKKIVPLCSFSAAHWQTPCKTSLSQILISVNAPSLQSWPNSLQEDKSKFSFETH